VIYEINNNYKLPSYNLKIQTEVYQREPYSKQGLSSTHASRVSSSRGGSDRRSRGSGLSVFRSGTQPENMRLRPTPSLRRTHSRHAVMTASHSLSLVQPALGRPFSALLAGDVCWVARAPSRLDRPPDADREVLAPRSQ
jgi:hypothetical protein